MSHYNDYLTFFFDYSFLYISNKDVEVTHTDNLQSHIDNYNIIYNYGKINNYVSHSISSKTGYITPFLVLS